MTKMTEAALAKKIVRGAIDLIDRIGSIAVCEDSRTGREFKVRVIA